MTTKRDRANDLAHELLTAVIDYGSANYDQGHTTGTERAEHDTRGRELWEQIQQATYALRDLVR